MPKPNDQMQAVLDAYAEMGPMPIEKLSPELARQQPLPDRAAVAVYGQNFTKKALAPMPMPVGKVENITISGSEGPVLLRIYTPKGDAPESGWPVLTYFHGGGWVIATLDTYDSSCRALCNAAHCVIVSAHYRQAPEHPFPAASQDAFAAYKWVHKNTARLNADSNQIAVGGESAGGNLAAVVCLMARDHNIVPMPVHQLLVYPVTDIAEGLRSASAKKFANAKPLNTPMLEWFYNHYVPKKQDRADPYLSPLYAESHEDLPSATIILAEIDPLFSDGKSYAKKLEAAGVDVILQVYEGVTHEFFGMAGLVKEADAAIKLAADTLKNAFTISEQKAAA